MAWTDEERERAIRLWQEGLSAAVIAGRLGQTRNAVIGVVHRAGYKRHGASGNVNAGLLTKRLVSARRKKKRTQAKLDSAKARTPGDARKPTRPNFIIDPPPVVEELVIPSSERMHLLVKDADGKLSANEAFTDAHCHWPIGDPQDSDFHFCGRQVTPGLPYCEAHALRAYQPPRIKTRRDKPIPTFQDSEMETA